MTVFNPEEHGITKEFSLYLQPSQGRTLVQGRAVTGDLASYVEVFFRDGEGNVRCLKFTDEKIAEYGGLDDIEQALRSWQEAKL